MYKNCKNTDQLDSDQNKTEMYRNYLRLPLGVTGNKVCGNTFSPIRSKIMPYMRSGAVMAHREQMDAGPTTSFEDDGEKEIKSFVTNVMRDDVKPEVSGIFDFLAKPVLVNNYVWDSVTNVRGTNLMQLLPGLFMVSNTVWANKLAGYQLFRGTAVIRVVINANPFQQGRLIMSYIPNYTEVQALDASMLGMHATIVSKTQLPNVELDCRETMMEMKIPYISPYNWFNLKSQLVDWGQVSLDVLSPLTVGSAAETTVDISVYLSFIDCEVAAPIVAQSNVGSSRGKYSVKKMNTAHKEESSLNRGLLVSDVLKEGASIAGALSTVPMLSSMASPAQWALNAASKTAAFFGYSKPRVDNSETSVARHMDKYGATSDGTSEALPLGLIAGNQLNMTDGLSIRPDDEMSFNFLKKVEANVQINGTWSIIDWESGADLSGTSLLNANIAPFLLYEQYTRTVGAKIYTYRVGPPIYYLSRHFRFWRGSIKLKLKIIKTNFHSGRLQLTWTPTYLTGVSPDLDTGQIALREILDIRECSEFEFNLPYLLEKNYIDCDTKSGILDIIVLNELRQPETCAGSVQILLYWSGGDDLEFEVPSPMGIGGVPYSAQMGEIREQMDGLERCAPKGVAGHMIARESTLYATESVGEMFTSVRQLLSRYTQVYETAKLTVNSGTSITVWPWFSGVSYGDATTIKTPIAGGDAYSMISPMYAYYRGGARIRISGGYISTGGNGTSGPTYAANCPNILVKGTTKVIDTQNLACTGTIGATPWVNTTLLAGFAGQSLQEQLGLNNYSIPYYSETKCSYVLKNTTSDVVFNDKTQPISLLCIYGYATLTNYSISRSFGEDFQLMFFLGAPPVFISVA